MLASTARNSATVIYPSAHVHSAHPSVSHLPHRCPLDETEISSAPRQLGHWIVSRRLRRAPTYFVAHVIARSTRARSVSASGSHASLTTRPLSRVSRE